ncbi:DUF4190 domain-containing protein [Oryzihumus leptocrescens]|nr:DUF4190 domain-containing protein [Oryzihumus leptocrescens]
MSELHATTPAAPFQAAKPFSGQAITAFILSLLWLGGIGSIVGLFLSISAMRETRDGRRAGQGLAVAALILSVLGLLSLGLMIVFIASAGNDLSNQFNDVNSQLGH